MASTLAAADGAWRVTDSVKPCLSLRDRGALEGRKLDCLESGTAVTAVAESEDWIQVRTTEGLTGWAARRFLEREVEVVAASLQEPSPAATREPFVRLEPWPAAPKELKVYRGDFRQRVLVTGELRATRATPVQVPHTPAWSVAVRWLIEEGTRVELGDPLAELDNSALASQLEDRRLAVVESQNTFFQALLESQGLEAEKEFEFERARIELEKARLAAEVPQGLLSEREYQDRLTARRRAEVEFDKVRDDLEAHRQASLAELEIQRIAVEKARRESAEIERGISELTMKAPASGIVQVERHYWQDREFRVGDTVWPGSSLLTLPDLSSIEVEARLVDVDDGAIEPGMPALCRLDAFPDETHSCRVTAVTPVAQQTSDSSLRRAFGVRLDLESADPERMRPGMSVAVEIESLRQAGVLLAPRAAIGFDAAGPSRGDGAGKVRAALGEGASQVVSIGPCNGSECVLLSGLAEGQRLARWQESFR